MGAKSPTAEHACRPRALPKCLRCCRGDDGRRSGSGGALLRPRPLRTGYVEFPITGSEGGPGKPTSRKAGRAPRSDPYTELNFLEGR